MLKFVAVVLLQVCGLIVSAQSFSVSGTVADSLDNKPLSSATLVVKGKEGNIIKTASSNIDGSFKININNKEASSVTISFVQYHSKQIALVFKEAAINLGTILLSANTGSLAEVIVQGKKAPVSFKIDRQLFKASQFTNAAGGTATDIIRNLPSVSVNGQGEILFRGSTSFLVLINGKPTQGEPSFVLAQLPAGSVENIEVITSPGAAYDADGKAGIINITTKTGVQDGWMILANSMTGTPPLKDFDNGRNPHRYSMDITAGYRKNKWDVSGGVNYLRNDIAGRREGDVYTIINNIQTKFPSVGERSFKRYTYGGRLAINYQADKNNLLSAAFYHGKKYQSRVADLLYNNSKVNALTGVPISSFTYYNENDQQKEGLFTLANLDYNHKLSDQSAFNFSLLYEKANLSAVTYNNNLRSRGSTDTLQYTVNPSTNPLNAFRTKIDYTKKAGNGIVQAGYQYRYDIQDGNFLYQVKLLGTNRFVTDPQFSSAVKATNYIHAAFVQYTGSTKLLNYSGGLRVEQSERNLSFSKNNEQKKLLLTKLFPSVQLRYKAWDKGVLKAGYSRRIKRTNNYELNPFPEREHSETLEQGDPELLPEFIGTYEAGMEQTFAKGNVFAMLYYQTVTNPIQRVNKVYNDTILNRIYTNAGKATQVGMETNFTCQVNNWWSCIIGGNVYKYTISGSLFNNTVAIENSSWIYSINSTQSFSLPKNFSMQLSVSYLSERVTAQGKDSRFFTPHFTLKKTTTDKRWSFQLQWLNIDAGMKQSNRQRITTYGANFYTTTNYVYEPNQLQFSIGFNLSKKNRKITLPQSEIGEKEF